MINCGKQYSDTSYYHYKELYSPISININGCSTINYIHPVVKVVLYMELYFSSSISNTRNCIPPSLSTPKGTVFMHHSFTPQSNIISEIWEQKPIPVDHMTKTGTITVPISKYRRASTAHPESGFPIVANNPARLPLIQHAALHGKGDISQLMWRFCTEKRANKATSYLSVDRWSCSWNSDQNCTQNALVTFWYV